MSDGNDSESGSGSTVGPTTTEPTTTEPTTTGPTTNGSGSETGTETGSTDSTMTGPTGPTGMTGMTGPTTTTTDGTDGTDGDCADHMIKVEDAFFIHSFDEPCPDTDSEEPCQELNFGGSKGYRIENSNLRHVLYAIRPAPGKLEGFVDQDKVMSATLNVTFYRAPGNDLDTVNFRVAKILGENDWKEGAGDGELPGVGSTYDWISKIDKIPWTDGGLMKNLELVCTANIGLTPDMYKSAKLCVLNDDLLGVVKDWVSGDNPYGLLVYLDQGGAGHWIKSREYNDSPPKLTIRYCK